MTEYVLTPGEELYLWRKRVSVGIHLIRHRMQCSMQEVYDMQYGRCDVPPGPWTGVRVQGKREELQLLRFRTKLPMQVLVNEYGITRQLANRYEHSNSCGNWTEWRDFLQGKVDEATSE